MVNLNGCSGFVVRRVKNPPAITNEGFGKAFVALLGVIAVLIVALFIEALYTCC